MPKNFDVGEVQALWDQLPATDMLTQRETADLFPIFYDAIEDMRYGVKLDESQSFLEYLDSMGMTVQDFPWQTFQEWYDAG